MVNIVTSATNKPDAIYQILYDSHVCTAKYGSGKLCETCEQLVQHALAAIRQEVERICLEVIGDDNIPYTKYEPCPACGAAYMYQCSCSTASDYIESIQRSRLTKALEDMKGEES